jgi:23S rRNA (uracil1939-C5)-methyltransferase
MDPEVIEVMLKANPNRIVYVSCNPATQARDLKVLCESAYKIEEIQPVDMFPHTHHCENIVSLVRK